MFYHGNNQAMQFLMQGYSNSIASQQNNALGNSLRNFNAGINDALKEDLNRKNMTKNLDLQDESIREARLKNTLSESTLQDKIEQERQNTESMKLDNEKKGNENTFTKKTLNSSINATNAENNAKTQTANLATKETQQKNNTYTYIGKSKNGKYYDLNGKEISKEQADIHNKNVDINKHSIRTAYAGANLEEAQRQTINNDNLHREKILNDSQNRGIENLLEVLKKDGYTPQELISMPKQIKLSNGLVVQNPYNMQIKSYSSGLYGTKSNNGSTGNINANNVNVEGRATDTRVRANSLYILNNPSEFSQEEVERARYNTIVNNKAYQDFSEKLGNAKTLMSALQNAQEADRAKAFIGFFSQYTNFNGDAQAYYANLKAGESQQLTHYGTSLMKGSLSDRDMEIIKEQTTNIMKSSHYARGIAKAMVTSLYNQLNALVEKLGSINALSDDQKRYYRALESAYYTFNPGNDMPINRY